MKIIVFRSWTVDDWLYITALAVVFAMMFATAIPLFGLTAVLFIGFIIAIHMYNLSDMMGLF